MTDLDAKIDALFPCISEAICEDSRQWLRGTGGRPHLKRCGLTVGRAALELGVLRPRLTEWCNGLCPIPLWLALSCYALELRMKGIVYDWQLGFAARKGQYAVTREEGMP